MTGLTEDTIGGLSKIELHRHLEGSVRLETLIELTQKRTGKVFGKERFVTLQPVENLTEFLEKFWHHQEILDSYDVVERIAFEVVEDASKDNIKLLELRYSPHFVSLGHPNLTYEGIHAAVMRGIRKAQEQYEIGVGLIGIMDRSSALHEASSALDFILQNKADFVAVDLANDEIKFDQKPFAHLFRNAKRAGLNVTVHAGEVDVPDAPLKVQEAVELLQADRIGHGIMSVHSDKVMQMLRERNVVLEVCPLSNYLTGVVKKLEEHPLRRLLDNQVPVCVSTDDPGVFGQTLVEEYKEVAGALRVSEEEFKLMNETAYKACFLDGATKQHFWKV
eukprot:Colp12_sorted_trinity150504_noHs@11032